MMSDRALVQDRLAGNLVIVTAVSAVCALNRKHVAIGTPNHFVSRYIHQSVPLTLR